jgi:beta-galactosidase
MGSDGFTRRDFLGKAAMAAAAASLALDESAVANAAPGKTAARVESFDFGWRFSRDDIAEAQSSSFGDAAWLSVDLPHDWSILGPYSKDEPSGGSGGYLPTGIGWYRKTFALPSSYRAKRVFIQFDGVYQRSEVWINGVSLGMRPYGYISFAYDLTPHLRFGGPANSLAVRVDNSLQPNSRWYSGSGINRHTWLVTVNPVHVALWGVCVRTMDVCAASATVEITTRIANDTGRATLCGVHAEVLDGRGRSVGRLAAEAQIPPGEQYSSVQHCSVKQPVLWDLADPQCHSLIVTLKVDGAVVDQVTNSFGIRDARFDADRGFLLNGERVKLNGVCLHNDCGAVGAAVPERMWQRRLELLKVMGCNAIRTSHNPPASEFLDLCDAMGFLVMEEAFDEWRQPKLQTPDYGYHKYFDEWAPRDLAAMIERDRNHPSVVLWSAGNEVPDQTDSQGPQTLQGLLDTFRRYDPTRAVTVGCDNIAAEPRAALPEFLAKLDVVGYNYVDRWRERREQFYSVDRHAYPRRRFIGTESTALGGVRGAYESGDSAPIFGERAGNRRIAVEQLQKFVQTYDYVSGDFLWTGIDYLGEAFWPNKLASSGVMDTCGYPKDGYYFYQSLWTQSPVLHLFPHWNWRGREGQVMNVMCYTNCDSVELFLNGKSLGTKGYAFPRPGMVDKYGSYPRRAKAPQTTADLHLAWDVPYMPGLLKATGMRNGEIVSTAEVRTTGDAAAIRLTADRSRIAADRRDVAHVKVEIVDAGGLPVPDADADIEFSLSGRGKIIGVDNGRPDSHESYQGSRRKAFNGLALVLLQSSGMAGHMVLKAAAPALTGAELELIAG